MAKKQQPRPDPIERREPLDQVKIEEMLAVVIRNRRAFDAVRELLEPKHFTKLEGDGWVWKVMLDFFGRHRVLPPSGTLSAELHNTPEVRNLDQNEREELDAFLDYAFDDASHGCEIATSQVHEKVALETCRLFLQEVESAALQLKTVSDGQYAKDLSTIIAEHRAKLQQIETITGYDPGDPFPDDWLTKKAPPKSSTGVAVLNAFMGGWQANDILLFMAMTGACKTTLAVHSTAAIAMNAALDFAEGNTRDGKRPVVVLVTLEDGADDCRKRIMANAARIPWSRLQDVSEGVAILSGKRTPGAAHGTGRNETNYEREEFAGVTAGFICERERVANAQAVLNQHLVIIDCTDDERPLGAGGIPDVANAITAHFRKRDDCYPVAIWFDHVKMLFDRMATANPNLDRNSSAVISRTLMQCRDMIVKKWNAPMGVLHQLSGEANGFSKHATPTHANGAGSKSIADYANFAVIASKRDEDMMCRFVCTKARRRPINKQRVVQIDSDFQRLHDRTDTHTVEDGQIISLVERDICAAQARARGLTGPLSTMY